MARNSRSSVSSEEIPRDIRSALLEFGDYKNEDTEAYKYFDLPKDKKRIRLLRLYPGVLKSPQVLCEMFEAEFLPGETLPRIVGVDGGPLKRSVEYEALSWRWGDEDNGKYTIMIRKDAKMYKKRVSETLGLALKYLRRSEDRILWIDAICINQKNKEERSYQVSMMSLVYTSAQQVCVWLGEDDDNSRKAIRFIREDISHLKDFDQLCNDQQHAHKWRAFLGLMQRDWFSRRWVVQEIALAPKASVYCGPDEIEWRELAIAVELFVEVETATHRLSELLRKDDKSRVVPNWFEHISELGASLLVNATARIFREYQRGDQNVRRPERRSLLSLEYLVTSLSIFDCGRPHDSVYALIAIARDASPNPPTSVKQKRQQALIAQVFGDQLEEKPYLLDYNSPYPDVCKEFVQFCIERCAKLDPLQALDVLCRPWAKDWRPGEASKMDEDQRVPPKKEGISRRSEGSSWEVSLLGNAKELLHSEDRFFKKLGSKPVAAQGQHTSGTNQTPGSPTPSVPAPQESAPEDEDEDTSQQPEGSNQSEPKRGAARDEGKPNGVGTQNSASVPVKIERHAKPKTHQDIRSMREYREQRGCRVKAPVMNFISLIFPKHREDAKSSKPEGRPFPMRQYQEEPEDDKWKKAEADIYTVLGIDPCLDCILHAKAELARIAKERAKHTEAESTRYKGSTNMNKAPNDSKLGHPKIQELGLPSWAAKIDGAPFDIFPHPGMDMVKMGRKNADPLVGTPQDGHRNYSAGQSKEVDLKTLQFRRRPQLGHYSLYLKGFCFDRVAKVAQVSQAGAIPASWLDLAGWPEARRPTGMSGNLDDPPTAFWRTLVADRGRNDRNPPYYYARACKETILKGGIRSNAVDTTALIYNERNSIIAEFCRRVQSVIWNRALIKTQNGALGLVSDEVREGDLICIIYGCTVPVILRRENAKFKTENEHKNEKLEDGVEAMKKLMPQLERYRERALKYSELSEKDKEDVKNYTVEYNEEHAIKKDPAIRAKEEETRKSLDDERKASWGKEDTQSDIEEGDSLSDIEEEEKIARKGTQGNEQNTGDQQQSAEQKAEEERQKKLKKEKEDEKARRHMERQRKAKVRDPLRHYRFLDQAYIHGMMDGEAVRQKFYTGKTDHLFEIR